MPTADLERAPRWEHFSHDADIGVRGIGATLASALEQLGLALTAVITDPERVRPERAVELRCAAPDPDLLAMDWLNALVYEMATRKMLFGRFEVVVADGELRATAWGEPVDVARHQPAAEVKGATFTGLTAARAADGTWVVEDVVDV